MLEIVLMVLVGIFVWLFIGYPVTLLILRLIYKSRKKVRRSFEYTPKVSILIPSYNESKFMKEKLENTLNLDYPKDKFEVICVDSGSIDGTPDIVREYSKQHHNVLLIEEGKRRGVVSAINVGLEKATGVVIALTEPATFLDSKALRNGVSYLCSSEIGAVTGNLEFKNSKNKDSFRSAFYKVKNTLRQMEGDIDTVSYASGELLIFKSSLVEDLDPSLVVEDTQIAYKIREKGYRVIVAKDAYCSEPSPKTFNAQAKYVTRTLSVSLNNYFTYMKKMFSPRYGIFGLLILPNTTLQAVLAPPLFIALMISFSVYVLLSNPMLFLLCLIGLSSLEGVLFALPQSREIAKASIYFVLVLIAALAGLFAYITNRYSACWEKLEK